MRFRKSRRVLWYRKAEKEIHDKDFGVRCTRCKGEEQKQLSKEFVRQWLIQNGFQGKNGQQIPEMTDDYIESVSNRYIELYENIIGEKFIKADNENMEKRIEKNVLNYLNQ